MRREPPAGLVLVCGTEPNEALVDVRSA
jgi:hypothetical protein